jgi:hypothetical protein
VRVQRIQVEVTEPAQHAHGHPGLEAVQRSKRSLPRSCSVRRALQRQAPAREQVLGLGLAFDEQHRAAPVAARLAVWADSSLV